MFNDSESLRGGGYPKNVDTEIPLYSPCKHIPHITYCIRLLKKSYIEYSKLNIVFEAATFTAALAEAGAAQLAGRWTLDRVDGVALLVDNVEGSSTDANVLTDRPGKLARWTTNSKFLKLINISYCRKFGEGCPIIVQASRSAQQKNKLICNCSSGYNLLMNYNEIILLRISARPTLTMCTKDLYQLNLLWLMDFSLKSILTAVSLQNPTYF